MHFKCFITGPIQVNTYLLYDEKSKDSILIDVGGSVKEILSFIQENRLNIKGIYNTHGHFDHIWGANEMQKELDCPFFINQNDAFLVENLEEQLKMFGIPTILPPKITGFIDENTKLQLGEHIISVIETPGHTPGGVCFLADDMLFSGDTLFLESIGRTDLPGGSYSELQKSIKEKLFALEDNINVYPGHEAFTSIRHEKAHNEMV